MDPCRFRKGGVHFQLYTDKELRDAAASEGGIDLSNVQTLIISPESLCLIKALLPKFDLVILDESESDLAQFNSPTMTKNPERQPQSFSALMRVCTYADKVLFLDGHASNRTVSLMQAIHALRVAHNPGDKPLAFIRNNYVVHKRTAVTLQSNTAGGQSLSKKATFAARMVQALSDGKNIFVFSDTATFAHQLRDTLVQALPDLEHQILLYTASMGDKHNNSVRYAETEWIKFRCVIYSPVITVSSAVACQLCAISPRCHTPGSQQQ
jgi:hypothetical protein